MRSKASFATYSGSGYLFVDFLRSYADAGNLRPFFLDASIAFFASLLAALFFFAVAISSSFPTFSSV